jgi:methyl-accepting chemotaxis protein
MVQRIAVAAEQQSCSTQEVSRNMEGLGEVTRDMQRSFAEVRTSAEGLAELASDLTGMVSWFRV